jgi:SAM-dependent methyltransferase
MNNQFLPNLRYIFINPFFITRRYLYLYIHLISKKFIGGSLLDIGCGTKHYRSLFKVNQYLGMDYSKQGTNQNSDADVIYEGKDFPFPDESFEFALATEVLEHVFEPDFFVKEIGVFLCRYFKRESLCITYISS